MHIIRLFFSFRGRIGRQSYWVGSLTLMVIGLMANLLDITADTTDDGFGLISLATSIGLIFPTLALTTKRWHDRDRSGWWTLILLVPIFGGLWMSIQLGFLKGVGWENRYGPDPLKFQSGSFPPSPDALHSPS